MGAEELRQTIEAEGRARVAAILAAAEERARSLRREAETGASLRRRERLRREEAALRREARASVAAEGREARKRVLEARQALLDRVFELAREALPAALESSEVRAGLIARAEQALARMPAGPVVISASHALAPELAARLAGREGVRVEPDEALSTGFQVSHAEAGLVVDGSLEERLARDRSSLAIEVLRRLQEQTPS